MAEELSITAPCDLDPESASFYRQVLETLNAAGVPFLVGGAYAFTCYTGIERQTKDLDLFIRRRDYEAAEAALQAAGWQTELSFPHWLGKVYAGSAFVDLIFNSGNGLTETDDDWFRHACDAEVLGVPVGLCPAEETIWSKAFIMERERHDGADVAHLLRARAGQLDWQRLVDRFGRHWRVLLSHMVLFGYIYPAERRLVPAWVMDSLLGRLREEIHAPPPDHKLCAGTLLSREQYLQDVEQQGYQDGRVFPFGKMSENDVAEWTRAIPDRQKAD
ncbi:nucleotidyltransferase family protein [Aquabacterium sp. A7-Y]|uniref:nucleotidyltransferase n=1 Tax=Aquabacterium sp. A7-Y TaxID=1349605 RepID=UPI00223D9779|nr:nucleotidyltransferase [Aquabacterium sp. A7-Y]MCW7538602.1 nucleotidyltransferase family protein [Aquabacterium sp. A7-Y]